MTADAVTDRDVGPFGLAPAHARTLGRLALVIPTAVPALLALFVGLGRAGGWGVVETAQRSAVAVMLVLCVVLLAPLALRVEPHARARGFVVFWFAVSSFFNLTWQLPLILFRGVITTAAQTHENLPKFVAWWGYGFADAHYGRVSRWMIAEELWWLLAIGMSLFGLARLRRGHEVLGFFWLGLAGALEAYNASLYMVYDAMTGLANIPDDSPISLVLYYGFNPLWAGAAALASFYAFRVVLTHATR